MIRRRSGSHVSGAQDRLCDCTIETELSRSLAALTRCSTTATRRDVASYNARVSRALILAVLAACGPKAAPGAPDDLLARDPKAAGESTRLAVPEPLVQIDLLVRDVAGLYLFDDEQLDAANMLAAWGKSAHLEVEPPARTREMLRRAANGQDALTGKACGSPLWSLPALERWGEALGAEGRIEAQVACLPSCVLIVKVSEGLDAASRDAGRTALWIAPYDPSQPWRTELPRRLAEVKPQPLTPEAQVDGALPPPAQLDAAFVRDEEPLPAALVPKVQACLGDAGAIGLVMEVDASGTVTHCEGYAQRIVGNAPVAACACKALAGATLGGGARRLATTVTRVPTPITKGGRELVAYIEPAMKRDAGTGLYLPIVSHRSVREWEPPRPWTIAACFADRAADAPPIDSAMTITVDGKTGTTALGGIDALSAVITPAQSACITAAIARSTTVPCPAPGTHTLSARLVVQWR